MALADQIADPERALALAYAPAAMRPALAAIWMLDEQLGAMVARTENPAAAQIRLTWWHDALKTLCTARPVDPVLLALAQAETIDPEALLPMIDGWEMLLDPLPIEPEALSDYARERGGTMFEVCSALFGGASTNAGRAGQIWALADLAFRTRDRTTAERALALAAGIDGKVTGLPKPLAILVALSRRDVRRGLDRPRRQGSPARVTRALIAGLTGL